MHKLPFQLLISRTSLATGQQTITCKELLRDVPGNRQVYDALWDGREVIVKLFSHKVHAKRHFKREWRGLTILNQRQLSAPEPLFYGTTEDSSRALVMEKISESDTADDIFYQTEDVGKRLELMILVSKQLAQQHRKGVLQADMHLGNFLLQGDRVYMTDPGQMHFYAGELDRYKSLAQLALLACYFSDSDTKSAKILLREYGDARQWELGEADESYFEKQLIVQRKKTIRRGLKKALRASKRNIQVKSQTFFAVFSRDFCQDAESADLIRQIDTLMEKGRVLKDGNTCLVSRVTWNGKDVVIKKYKYKGFFHSLRHTIKGSRARRSWLNAQRLGMLSINTPTPLAFIERRRGRFILCSYFIAKFTDAPSLYTVLKSEDTTESQRLEVVGKVKELIGRLGRYKITHGDLKHTNIFVAGDSLILTDLDAMKVHKSNCAYRRGQARDMDRFEKYGQRYLAAENKI
ncbi:MAG: hypothetical protein FVQ80_08030 [Planctomycetes bacterium]|nr:hypothetical protein [Planctomycetota bacterium]